MILTMKTVHGSIHNQTAATMRLSCDVRYQPLAHDIDDRWMLGADSERPTAHDNYGKTTMEKTKTMEQAKVEWGLVSGGSGSGSGGGSKL